MRVIGLFSVPVDLFGIIKQNYENFFLYILPSDKNLSSLPPSQKSKAKEVNLQVKIMIMTLMSIFHDP